MRIIASFKKGDSVRFVSHLDIQRMLHRTVSRAKVPIAYSQGFNPHPLISFATALSVGQTGDNEWIDFHLDKDISVDEFVGRMNSSFPNGFSINSAFAAPVAFPSVSSVMKSADYITYAAQGESVISSEMLNDAVTKLLSGEIIIKKTKKKGRYTVETDVNIRDMVHSITVAKCDDDSIFLAISGRLDAAGGLNVSKLLDALNDLLSTALAWSIHRKRICLDVPIPK